MGVMAPMFRSLRGARLALALIPVLFTPAPAMAFGIEALRKLIDTQQPTGVAELVAALPREMRENYTLAWHSQSLQGASHDNPRAILFDRLARFVVTFNGEPSQAHGNTVEIMQYRPGSESFEFYEIAFQDERALVSGANPALCKSCHGATPHPVWSSYEYGRRETSHWPGMYGSSHDAPLLNPEERAAFERFRARAASHPRYRHLRLSHPQAAWFPYATGPTRHRFRPNNRLGNLLARWHARQIVALIRAHDFIDRHAPLAQAWLLQCPVTLEPVYRQRVARLFESRFPRRDHAWIHALRAGLPAARRTAFMMERLLTGRPGLGWDMSSAEAPEASGRYYTGIVTIDQLVGARWLASVDESHWLRSWYRPWRNRQLYDSFAPGYYAANVAPGGVGAAYDEVMGYYGAAYARRACPRLRRAALTAPTS